MLEIGVGPGVNFVHYDPTRVSKVYALEPNQAMVWQAEEQRRRTQLQVEFLELLGEQDPATQQQRRYCGQHVYLVHHSRSDGRYPGHCSSFAAKWPVYLL